jgi:hypothetical protein
LLEEKFERIKEDKEAAERLETGVEDKARCLWQEYQRIKGEIQMSSLLSISRLQFEGFSIRSSYLRMM